MKEIVNKILKIFEEEKISVSEAERILVLTSVELRDNSIIRRKEFDSKELAKATKK